MNTFLNTGTFSNPLEKTHRVIVSLENKLTEARSKIDKIKLVSCFREWKQQMVQRRLEIQKVFSFWSGRSHYFNVNINACLINPSTVKGMG